LKNFVQFVLFFSCTFLIAQSSLIDGLYGMQKNPHLKEKVYVHTNKTSYFNDDVIWFKAYVGDSINLPSIETRVLEVELFDDQGNHVFDRKIAITGGTGHGQFELNDAVPPGKYYLRARTNYMRNFGEEYRYLQEIEIFGEKVTNRSTEEHINYEIQFLPEGGQLIEDVQNTLGIKATVNGRGIDFQGTIIDEEGKTVSTFSSEHEGMGKCSLVYEKGKTYLARIKVQDTHIEQALPKALAKGVSLQADNSDGENLKVYLKTNEGTFYDQVYSNYKLLFHQDRQLFQLVSVARLDSITGLIETNKNIFLDGVITATLFANDEPIAERKFFIETDRKKPFVSLEKSSIDNDSITYTLLARGQNEKLMADLSVSVLSKTSEVADLNNTIKSSFLLTPYVKGHIENPGYYFNPSNEKRKEHLDLLLLTQGWTGYTLKEMIEKKSPIEKYAFETGFELKGKIDEDTKRKNVVLIPDNFRILDKAKLEGNPDFNFQNLDVFKGDTVRVAYQNWLGKIIKPEKIVYDTVQKKTVATLNVPKRFKIANAKNNAVYPSDKTNGTGLVYTTDNQLQNLDGIIGLDEVIVTEKQRDEKYFERRKIIEKYEPLVSNIGTYYDLPIPEVASKYNASLMDLIGLQGYRLRTNNNVQYELLGPLSRKGPKTAYLFINGRLMQPEELTSIQLHMKDIANIMVSNLGTSGVIFQVFTAETTIELFDRFVIKNGYDRAKKYYTPLSTFEQSKPKDLLEIDWKPNLKTDEKGEVFFKILKNSKTRGLLFSIQGFSEKGHLISERIVQE
jgi:hypothetical protein